MTFVLLHMACLIALLMLIISILLLVGNCLTNKKIYGFSCYLLLASGILSVFFWYHLGYFQGQVDHANNQNHVYLNKTTDKSTEWIYTHSTTQPSK